MSDFKKILEKYRQLAFSERDKGEKFERLMQAYLQTDPTYANLFNYVWLWNEFPSKMDFGGKDVFDVMVGEVGQVIPEENLNEEQRTEFYSCPECKGKNLTIWNPHYRKCPKCDGRMTLDKTAFPILWD